MYTKTGTTEFMLSNIKKYNTTTAGSNLVINY